MDKHKNISKLLSRDKAISATQQAMASISRNDLYIIDSTVNYTIKDRMMINGEITVLEDKIRKIKGKQSSLQPSDAEAYLSYNTKLQVLQNKLKVVNCVSEQVEVATKYFNFSKTKTVIKNGKQIQVYKTPQELMRERDKRILALYEEYKRLDNLGNRKFNADKEFFKAVYSVNQVYQRTVLNVANKHPELVKNVTNNEQIIETSAGVGINKDGLSRTMADEIVSASESYIEKNKDVFHNDLISIEGVQLFTGKFNQNAAYNINDQKRLVMEIVDRHKKLIDIVNDKVFCEHATHEDFKEHLIDEKVIVALNKAQNEAQVKKILIEEAKEFVQEHKHTNEITKNEPHTANSCVRFVFTKEAP